MADLDPRTLARGVLPLIRSKVQALGRALVVLEISDRARASVTVYDAPPPDECLRGDDRLCRSFERVWERHDPQLTIPFVVADYWAPFVGLAICPLPWAPPGEPWCSECGGRHSRRTCPP